MLPELDAASRAPGVQQLLGQRGDVLPRWGEVSDGELLDRADEDLLVVRRENAAVGMGVSARETAPESMVEGGGVAAKSAAIWGTERLSDLLQTAATACSIEAQ